MGAKSSLDKMNDFERAEKVYMIARLYMQGKPKVSIAKELDIPLTTVEKAIKEWDEYISMRAEADPDIMEKFTENVFRFDEEIRMINEQAWEVVRLAEENGAMSTKLQALRLAKDLMETKARLFQLMSPRLESGYIERTKKVERVNSILSEIIRTTISNCPRCSDLAWSQLQDAWRNQPELSDGEVTR
jgi:hypothetical protein